MNNPIDERIERFEYYMRHRVLRVAEILARHFDSGVGELSESGFFILSGVSSYFETINQFLTGEDSEGIGRDPVGLLDGVRGMVGGLEWIIGVCGRHPASVSISQAICPPRGRLSQKGRQHEEELVIMLTGRSALR